MTVFLCEVLGSLVVARFVPSSVSPFPSCASCPSWSMQLFAAGAPLLQQTACSGLLRSVFSFPSCASCPSWLMHLFAAGAPLQQQRADLRIVFFDRLQQVFQAPGQVVVAALRNREHPWREPGVDGDGVDQALIFGVFFITGLV